MEVWGRSPNKPVHFVAKNWRNPSETERFWELHELAGDMGRSLGDFRALLPDLDQVLKTIVDIHHICV